MLAFFVNIFLYPNIYYRAIKNTLSFMADHKRKGEKSLDMVVVPNQACS